MVGDLGDVNVGPAGGCLAVVGDVGDQVGDDVAGSEFVAVDHQLVLEPGEDFVSASGVGIYGEQGETELTEDATLGSGFLAETAKAWEAEAQATRELTRTVQLRTPMVLGRKGGALQAMLPIFRAGLGGRLGSGQQWMPWIHVESPCHSAISATACHAAPPFAMLPASVPPP